MIAKLNYFINSGEILKWLTLLFFGFTGYMVVKMLVQLFT